MTTSIFCIAAAALALAAIAEAGRGGLIEPKPRAVTDTYKRLGYKALKQSPEEDIMLMSLEQLDTLKSQEVGHSPFFNVHNGCRGMVYEPTRPVTTLTYDTDVIVKWDVTEPAPGVLEINVVKPISDFGTPFIRHTPIRNLARLDKFGEQPGPGSVSVRIPEVVTGCEVVGACSIQFHWRTAAGETFDSCADIRMQPKRTEFVYVRPLSALNSQNVLLTAGPGRGRGSAKGGGKGGGKRGRKEFNFDQLKEPDVDIRGTVKEVMR